MKRQLAPAEIRNNESIKPFLESRGLKGSIHEVMIARVHSRAINNGDTKAIKLILDKLNNKMEAATIFHLVISESLSKEII